MPIIEELNRLRQNVDNCINRITFVYSRPLAVKLFKTIEDCKLKRGLLNDTRIELTKLIGKITNNHNLILQIRSVINKIVNLILNIYQKIQKYNEDLS